MFLVLISRRLLILTEMIIKGEVTADIGADHGELAKFLVERRLASRVIASELGDGPYRRLLTALNDSPYREQIEVRQGEGLTVLDPGETVNVVIAGLGGDEMVKILSRDWQKAASFKRFVFQPMSKPEALRRVLCRKGWPILEERLVEDNGRLFVAISGSPGNNPYRLSALEIDIGPFLLRDENIFRDRYLKSYLQKYRQAYSGLLKAKILDDSLLDEYQGKIKELEAILNDSTG
jgi:tRNA (adenine22-N1)-methyltransferase